MIVCSQRDTSTSRRKGINLSLNKNKNCSPCLTPKKPVFFNEAQEVQFPSAIQSLQISNDKKVCCTPNVIFNVRKADWEKVKEPTSRALNLKYHLEKESHEIETKLQSLRQLGKAKVLAQSNVLQNKITTRRWSVAQDQSHSTKYLKLGNFSKKKISRKTKKLCDSPKKQQQLAKGGKGGLAKGESEKRGLVKGRRMNEENQSFQQIQKRLEKLIFLANQ